MRTDVGASRVLDGTGLIAYEPFAYAAVVPHGDKYFWMHDWTDDYQEASIAHDIADAQDLRQIAFDAGVQMGRAHPKRPDGGPTRTAAGRRSKSLDAIERRVRTAMKEMAGRTDAAWRAFARSHDHPEADDQASARAGALPDPDADVVVAVVDVRRGR